MHQKTTLFTFRKQSAEFSNSHVLKVNDLQGDFQRSTSAQLQVICRSTKEILHGYVPSPNTEVSINGVPLNHPFSTIFPCKPSMLGYPHGHGNPHTTHTGIFPFTMDEWRRHGRCPIASVCKVLRHLTAGTIKGMTRTFADWDIVEPYVFVVGVSINGGVSKMVGLEWKIPS